MMLCLMDWLHAAAAEIALRRLATIPFHGLKVARTLHPVFLTYIILGSLEEAPPRGWPCPISRGVGARRTIDLNFRLEASETDCLPNSFEWQSWVAPPSTPSRRAVPAI